ncbi:MAG: hypothetical protein A2341_05330 [Deltaproteobacteria bacterium RIFOXYB12_FULL_58_9]|nr:MAG: hypothetical protein A2341_05330 [Deltaproteobacteria bacterium RIFOXYB12_FULL_58_9]
MLTTHGPTLAQGLLTCAQDELVVTWRHCSQAPERFTVGGTNWRSIEKDARRQLESDVGNLGLGSLGERDPKGVDSAYRRWCVGEVCFELKQDHHHRRSENKHGHQIERDVDGIVAENPRHRGKHQAEIVAPQTDLHQVHLDLVFGPSDSLLIAHAFVDDQRQHRSQN